ncbi:MAG: transposase [Candidatus Paceibacterota bacterium]
MRNIQISTDEHYHIYNRGTHKRIIFHDTADYVRFLFLILFLQSPIGFGQVSRPVHHFVKHRVFDIDVEEVSQIIHDRYVELIAFCLMPNHFHLILRETQENGIAKYMQRVLNGYTKYYNTKYEVSGHLFQGPYRAIHVENNDQLLYLSTYIHRNIRELSQWKNKEQKYEWSSYQDYIGENRWDKLLSTELIQEQFKTASEYETFVLTSVAKMLDGEYEEFENDALENL